jgi:site-specific recombinase XerD
MLQPLCAERTLVPNSEAAVFINRRGQPLTRIGVRYILAKYCDRAIQTTPSLAAKRLHPHSTRHSTRHSTAVHLLKSGVDLVSISHGLGHASPNTTNRYATLDMEMKRAAIAKAQPPNDEIQRPAAWKTDTSILTWLELL